MDEPITTSDLALLSCMFGRPIGDQNITTTCIEQHHKVFFVAARNFVAAITPSRAGFIIIFFSQAYFISTFILPERSSRPPGSIYLCFILQALNTDECFRMNTFINFICFIKACSLAEQRIGKCHKVNDPFDAFICTCKVMRMYRVQRSESDPTTMYYIYFFREVQNMSYAYVYSYVAVRHKQRLATLD